MKYSKEPIRRKSRDNKVGPLEVRYRGRTEAKNHVNSSGSCVGFRDKRSRIQAEYELGG